MDVAEQQEDMRQWNAIRQKTREEGAAALQRLMVVAQHDSGQCRHIAGFLLGLYNSRRFKFELTDFRAIDKNLFDDCLCVLMMDRQPKQNVDMYFENGDIVFEQLAERWDFNEKKQRQ